MTSPDPTDDSLLERARRGEPAAVARIVARLQPDLRRALDKKSGAQVRRWLSVSDLEQEVLLRVPELVRRLAPDAGFDGLRALVLRNAEWVVQNAARGRQRFDGESVAPVGAAAGPAASRTSGDVTLADEAARVERRLADLSPELADVVRLRLQDRSFAEIAQRLDISEATARRRFLEAAHVLRGPA